MRYFTFFYLYAMQGIPGGFALTAIANYLIGQGASAPAVGTFDAVIGIPWVVQFVWGPVIDRYQFSRMGHRRHWIIFSQVLALLATLPLLFVSQPVAQAQTIALLFVIHSLFASIQDASVDATAIALVPVAQQGRANAFMRAGYLLGIATGAAGFSTLLHRYGFFYAAACQSAVLLLFTIITYIIKIERTDSYAPSFHLNRSSLRQDDGKHDNPDIRWLFARLYKGITQRSSLRIFGAVLLVYLCLSTFIRSFSFHLIHHLHWNDNELSVLQGTWGSLSSIVIILCGGVLADRFGARRMQRGVVLALCIFFLVFGSLGALWAHRGVSTAGILLYNMADPVFSVAAMPVLMALCLAKVEGSQFTAYMAMVNMSDITGAYLSGWGMERTTGPVIGIICGMVLLVALWLLRRERQEVTPEAAPLHTHL